MKSVSIIAILLCLAHLTIAQPSISSFAPERASVGSTITIAGNNFSTTASANIVYFGAVRATVTNATTTMLTVTVPPGADYEFISVTTNALTAWSSKPFHPVFSGSETIRSSAARNPVLMDEEASTIRNINKADFDGDGKTDLLVWYPNVDKISVYRNTTTDQVISFENTDLTFDGGIQAITADMDNDSKPDILLFYNQGVMWFRNTSTGNTISFDSPIDIPLTVFTDAPVWTDWDQDGLGDIICAGGTSIYIYRHLLNGAVHSFAAPVLLPVGHSVDHISIGDIDGDSKPDALATVAGYNIICLRNSSTTGSVSFTNYTLESLSDPWSAALIDVDNDGRPDAVLRAFTSDVFKIAIVRNESTPGNVSFAAPVYNEPLVQSSDLFPSDYNGDGKIDLVLVGSQSFVLENTSTTGLLQFRSVYLPLINLAFRTTLSDLDHDEKPDIITIEEKFSVIRNQVGEPFVKSFGPQAAPANTTVNIQGEYLTAVNEVTFGGTPANSFTVVSDSEINAIVGNASNGNLRVASPNGSYSLEGFDFIDVAAVTSFSPASGVAGQVVVITGSNFTHATGVSFGGTNATSFTILSDTEISAVIAEGPSGTVAVVTPAGEAVSEDIFKYGLVTGTELLEENKLQVYPNPVVGKLLSLRWEGMQPGKPVDLTLIDMNGKTIKRVAGVYLSTRSTEFALPENLGAGMYILKFSSTDETLIRKVIVK